MICINFTGQEKGVISRFSKEMENVQNIAKKSIMWRGFLNSMNQMISTAAYGIAIWYGGVMVAHHEIYYKDVIRYSYICNSDEANITKTEICFQFHLYLLE